MNSETFRRGFTIETFVKVPLGFNNPFNALMSRYGASGQAGKADGDPKEPVFTIAISGGREPQVVSYPLNQTGPTTNWGHTLPEDEWWHLAVVNDGRRTILYVEGCPTVDNPHTVSRGLAALGMPWALGGSQYDGSDNTVFNGFVGDVRIVNRPLPVAEFMIGG